MVHTAPSTRGCSGAGALPLNVKIVVEGEEEIGSSHLAEFLQYAQALLAADAIVLTDTGNFDTGLPSITTALRGLVAVDVEVRALKQSLHSGMWGGPVPDADDGAVQDAGVARATTTGASPSRASTTRCGRSPTAEKHEHRGAADGRWRTFREQAGMLAGRRSCSAAGGTRGRRTGASRRLSVNAHPGVDAQGRAQHHQRVGLGARRHPHRARHGSDVDVSERSSRTLKKAAPWGVQVEIHAEAGERLVVHGPGASRVPGGVPRAEEGLRHATPVAIGCGGSIPFVEPFARELGGVPALLIGVEDPYTNAHSENESLHLGDWDKAVRSAIYLYEELARGAQEVAVRAI